MTDASTDVLIHVFPAIGLDEYVTYDDYAAIASQLEAQKLQTAAAIEAVATARADGYAEGVLESAKVINDRHDQHLSAPLCQQNMRALSALSHAACEVLALIPASPSEPAQVTAQEAANVRALVKVANEAKAMIDDRFFARYEEIGKAVEILKTALAPFAGTRP